MDTYEKKYKEALERAKEIIECSKNSGAKEVRMVLSFFPELKESEDERMRNAAINACKYMVDNFENSTKDYEDAISWLEKQGEKKSIESTKNKLNESMIKPDPNPYWTLAPEYKLMNEQKPAVWSEEDENGLGNTLWAIQQAIKVAKDENDIGTIWCAKRWLKSLKDRVQPKQEWSEEDEEMIDSIIGNIKYLYSIGSCDNATVDKKVNWLKSLSTQNTWKPSK